jgi:hypothetical protein
LQTYLFTMTIYVYFSLIHITMEHTHTQDDLQRILNFASLLTSYLLKNMVKQYKNIKVVIYATNNMHMKITFSH